MEDGDSGADSSIADASSTGDAGEPGFGDAGGDDGLPSMEDSLPTFDEPENQGQQTAQSGDAGGNSGNDQSSQGGAGAQSTQDGNMAEGSSGAGAGAGGTQTAQSGDYGQPEGTPQAVGTRADGGLEPFPGSEGTLTRAEQVAILDRQLEQSTSEFDGIIMDAQMEQRDRDRQRESEQQASAAAAAGGGYEGAGSGNSPYRENGGMGGGSVGGGMGGVSRSTQAPQNPAKFEPPEDIPSGSDDDVVARQLREAAMREPDPEVRERLWNEYRKYKGLEIPE